MTECYTCNHSTSARIILIMRTHYLVHNTEIEEKNYISNLTVTVK